MCISVLGMPKTIACLKVADEFFLQYNYCVHNLYTSQNPHNLYPKIHPQRPHFKIDMQPFPNLRHTSYDYVGSGSTTNGAA